MVGAFTSFAAASLQVTLGKIDSDTWPTTDFLAGSIKRMMFGFLGECFSIFCFVLWKWPCKDAFGDWRVISLCFIVFCFSRL